MRLWYLGGVSRATDNRHSKGLLTKCNEFAVSPSPSRWRVCSGSAAPVAANAATTITISGATASYPLVSLLAQKYVKLHPGKVKFKIAQGGAQVGINDVAAGRVTIGDVSRDPLASDPAGLVFYPIAKYGICVITNKSDPLANLTTAQLIGIFTGKTRSWSGIPGATADRHDRPDQPHLGGRRADQLPDDPAGRQESRRASPPNSPPRV